MHRKFITTGNVTFRRPGRRTETTPNPLLGQPVPDSSSERILAKAIAGEYRYAMLGIVLGALAIVGGVILGLNGVAGATSWTAKLLGLESQINDAAPGVVLFIVGLFMIVATKPRVRLGDLKDR